MDQMWIGSITANSVSGNIGVGYAIITGMSTLSKSNTGNGSITGDFGQQPTLAAWVHDPDQWDTLLLASQPQGRG